MTGGLSNFGIVTGFDFSGGTVKAPLAVAAGFVLLAVATGLEEAAGVGWAVADVAGVGVAAGGGVVVVCARTQTANALNATTMLANSCLNVIRLREQELSSALRLGNARQKVQLDVDAARSSRSLGR